jgi:hypothetical protein
LNELTRHAVVPGEIVVELDRQAAPLELRDERAQELVAAAGRRRRELVEECEIGATSAAP